MTRIERVLPDTLHLLERVAEDVFDGPVNPDHAQALLATCTHILLVAMDGQLCVGQCLGLITHTVDAPPALFVDNLGVAPSHRRQGIGRALMAGIWQAGRDAGCNRFWLGSDPESDSALPFYQSLGLRFQPAEFCEMDFGDLDL